MILFAIIILLYLIGFIFTVIRGHAKYWPDGYGFTYSSNEQLDMILGKVFFPLYKLVKPFGIQRLSQIFKSLK